MVPKGMLREGAFWREVLSMVVTGDGRAGETVCESRCESEGEAAIAVFAG